MENNAVSAVMIATEYKTVSQIADEMGVSKQAAYKKLESRKLTEALKPHIAYDYKGVMRFDEDGVRLIESTFKSKPLKDQLAELKEELAVKDALISKLFEELQIYEQNNFVLQQSSDGVFNISESEEDNLC